MVDRLSRLRASLHHHATGSAPPLTDEQRAARQRWQQRWNLPIILAAVVPLFATSPANRAAEVAIGLGSWAIFAVDLYVQRRIVPDYLSRRNGRIDLAIVVLTFPFYLVPGIGGTTAILVLARLARVARLLMATAGLRRFAARLGKIAVFAGLIVLVASFVAYWAEHPTNPEYATVGDAIWWGVVTLTTVGYGDIVPETTTGRFAGMAIMFTGVATIGILAGSLASLFHLGDEDEAAEEAEPGESAAVARGARRAPVGAAGGRPPPGPARRPRAGGLAMSEGLSATEVGKEIGAHAKHSRGHEGRDRTIAIGEALLLSIVTILAAWSGFSAAKWGTESSLALAEASATRTTANREFQESLIFRVGDATTFNAWFDAYLAGNEEAVEVAERRFRPEFRVAFDAWIATDPFENPDAPPGPQAMPEYVPTGLADSQKLDEEADVLFAEGHEAAETADNYVRTTVILASVLFLVGISTQFPLRGVRYGLLAVGAGLLVFAVVLILLLPGPPS